MKNALMVLFCSIICALSFGWIGGETENTNEAFSAICIVLSAFSSVVAVFAAITVLVE